MEKMLQKLARQLDGLDEASLMALWSKYATLTSRFEPTRRWEDACLIFSLIQAKRFKNQLFNCYWKKERQPLSADPEDGSDSVTSINFDLELPDDPERRAPCRILSFEAPKPNDASEEKDD